MKTKLKEINRNQLTIQNKYERKKQKHFLHISHDLDSCSRPVSLSFLTNTPKQSESDRKLSLLKRLLAKCITVPPTEGTAETMEKKTKQEVTVVLPS